MFPGIPTARQRWQPVEGGPPFVAPTNNGVCGRRNSGPVLHFIPEEKKSDGIDDNILNSGGRCEDGHEAKCARDVEWR